jgi:hypothetical protein
MQRLTAALDRRDEPLTLFFRDDDAGWGMDALDAMVGVFERYDCPVDLAVIPAALTQENAGRLNTWTTSHHGIGLHQHGYAHQNHEAEGVRKCEFGSARPVERQCADIMMGRARLASMLDKVDPIFTPPWNRCLPETVARLRQIGFAAYSADHLVEVEGDGPAMLPVSLDWERALRDQNLVEVLAALLSAPIPQAGIMLHHAVMQAEGLDLLDQLFSTISRHPKIACVSMRQLLETTP